MVLHCDGSSCRSMTLSDKRLHVIVKAWDDLSEYARAAITKCFEESRDIPF
jgi:hypothetical protein